MSWQNFNASLDKMNLSDAQSLREYAVQNWDQYQVYPSSLHLIDGAVVYLAKEERDKKLVIIGGSDIFQAFQGETAEGSRPVKICPLNAANAQVLRERFPFTAPVSLQDFPITIGLGDRLGIASPGHLRLLKRYSGAVRVRPILAQQSIRELNLTGRTYQEVLDAASWAVFQEDYQAGFGADGDHLKTAVEVKMALDCGFTMITLDCSEHIDNDISSLSPEETAAKYRNLPPDVREAYENTYQNKDFEIQGLRIRFAEAELVQTVLIYHHAIQHTIRIYHDIIATAGRAVDFEVSIDETLTPTTPQAHFLVASELQKAGVAVASLAPRFCGEFQKGIDYRGDLAQFETEFIQHAQIAVHFHYKLSIHSGSDKFKVFPIIGRETARASAGKFHLKTAGTNWLEAVRIVARYDSALFREIYDYAGKHLNEAKKYYHISATAERIPAAAGLTDQELLNLLSDDDGRQVLHITYGLILQAQDDQGKSLFKERFFALLFQYEAEFYEGLEKHIGKHLQQLGI